MQQIIIKHYLAASRILFSSGLLEAGYQCYGLFSGTKQGKMPLKSLACSTFCVKIGGGFFSSRVCLHWRFFCTFANLGTCSLPPVSQSMAKQLCSRAFCKSVSLEKHMVHKWGSFHCQSPFCLTNETLGGAVHIVLMWGELKSVINGYTLATNSGWWWSRLIQLSQWKEANAAILSVRKVSEHSVHGPDTG